MQRPISGYPSNSTYRKHLPLASTNHTKIKPGTSETTRAFNMKKIYPFILSFLTLPALSNTAENPCEKIEASQQIAQCTEYKKEQSNKTLNLSYKETLGRIKHQYKKSPALSDQYLSLLRGAQKEWIKLRDADCKLEAFEIEETSEAYQTTINNCISRMSNNRTLYLKNIAPDI